MNVLNRSHKAPIAQRGFTLAEVSIVLAVLALLVFALDLTPFLKQKEAVETEKRLSELQVALTAAYRQNQLSIEADPTARLNFGAVQLNPVPPTQVNVAGDLQLRCLSNENTFASIANFSSSSAATLFRDGSGSSMCVVITPQLTRNFNGVNLRYHSVAVIAPGASGKIANNPGPGGCVTGLNNATGNLTLCLDNKGIVVDGYQLAVDAYKTTQKRMEKIAAAYEIYFTTRSIAAADPSVDYFASNGANFPATTTRWDQGANPIPVSAVGGVCPANGVPLNTLTAGGVPVFAALGLGLNDVTDAFGQVMNFDNCSNAVRSPVNGTGTSQVAPFTAAIVATGPGGAIFRQAVVGLVN